MKRPLKAQKAFLEGLAQRLGRRGASSHLSRRRGLGLRARLRRRFDDLATAQLSATRGGRGGAMRLEFSGPLLESLNGKQRQSFP